MASDKKLIFVTAVLLSWSAYTSWANRWMHYDEAAIKNSEPLQQALERPAFTYKGFTLTPVASFNLEARVLCKERYYWGRESTLAPIDFAFGWGPMAHESVLKGMKISQSNRWYHYRYKEPPIVESEIISHSSNMHLIPANSEVYKNIKKARPGQLVRLRGYLVNVTASDGWYWNSSLSRTDIGAHACELFWVDAIELL